MSMGASGTIGGLVNYRQTQRGTVARVHSQPTGEPTSDQLAIRAITKQVSQAWASVSPTDRLTWTSLAIAGRYSTFNAFFVENFKRVSAGLSITNVWPPVNSPPVLEVDVTTLDGNPEPSILGTYFYLEMHNDKVAYAMDPDLGPFIYHDGYNYVICSEYTDEHIQTYYTGPYIINGGYSGCGDWEGAVTVSTPH